MTYKYKYFINSVELAKKMMYDIVEEGSKVIDCTVGNGNDTLLLAKLVGKAGKVYGFDIQEDALKSTKKKLITNGMCNRVTLINDGHENMDNYINEKVELIVFNLGYLPRGDHKIITKPETTLRAIKKGLKLLNDNGLMFITCYTGHKGGNKEKECVENYINKLEQKSYSVLKFKFINQINNPPILYGVEKLHDQGGLKNE